MSKKRDFSSDISFSPTQPPLEPTVEALVDECISKQRGSVVSLKRLRCYVFRSLAEKWEVTRSKLHGNLYLKRLVRGWILRILDRREDVELEDGESWFRLLRDDGGEG